MSQKWEVVLDNQEKRRKVAMLEGRARRPEQRGEAAEEVEFSLTLYADQVSLNVPASTPGREFIVRLTEILGPPKLPPTIKCSCSWGDGVMGAMLIVLWDLPPEAGSPRLQALYTLLGNPGE